MFRRLAHSFYFAFAGLFFLFRTQRNARIELALGLCAMGVAWWVGISRAEWGVLVLASFCVIILEGLNTAVEAAVDLASPEIHPLANILLKVDVLDVNFSHTDIHRPAEQLIQQIRPLRKVRQERADKGEGRDPRLV